MDKGSQQSTPLKKCLATDNLESQHKRFSMFATNENDPDITLSDHSQADDIAILPLSNHTSRNDMDITNNKSTITKVPPFYETVKSDISRTSLAQGLGNVPKYLTTRFIVTHHIFHTLCII